MQRDEGVLVMRADSGQSLFTLGAFLAPDADPILPCVVYPLVSSAFIVPSIDLAWPTRDTLFVLMPAFLVFLLDSGPMFPLFDLLWWLPPEGLVPPYL